MLHMATMQSEESLSNHIMERGLLPVRLYLGCVVDTVNKGRIRPGFEDRLRSDAERELGLVETLQSLHKSQREIGEILLGSGSDTNGDTEFVGFIIVRPDIPLWF